MIASERSFLVLLTFCSIYPVSIKTSASFKVTVLDGWRHPQAILGPYSLGWVKASPCQTSFLECQVGRCHYDEQIYGGKMGKTELSMCCGKRQNWRREGGEERLMWRARWPPGSGWCLGTEGSCPYKEGTTMGKKHPPWDPKLCNPTHGNNRIRRREE